MDTPNNWEHKSGYHLNADGKAIKYKHTEKPWEAIIESMNNQSNFGPNVQYYTAIFGETSMIKEHEVFNSKENAKNHLQQLMKKHN